MRQKNHFAGTGQLGIRGACSAPEMKLSAAILSLVIAAAPAAVAAPRIAVVRVADVYKSLDATRKQQDAVAANMEALQKDRRATELLKMRNSLREQYTSLPQKPTTAAEMAKVREYALKYREATTLQEDFNSFCEEEVRNINIRKVKEMRQSLDLIVETARKIGKDEGIDWVFDTSGNTNTSLPLVVYAKAPLDLTDRVLSALQPNKAIATPVEAAKAPAEDSKR